MIDRAVQRLFQSIEAAGYSAYFVGGCVRNAIMGVPVSDIDIATDATPDQMQAICDQSGFRSVPTGIEHGTVTVVVDGQSFEVTTFRKDVATDGRRAVVVFSTDMGEDARRRDFTMNALYADRRGAVFDPVLGLEDARARRVRFIDDASERIREDYLRTLRFFRFNAQYATSDTAWDSEALAGIAANLDGLSTLSAERVGAEMLKLLAAPDPTPAVSIMQQTGVLPMLLPGADPVFLGPFVHLQAGCDAQIDALARLAALGGTDVADRLRLSKRNRRHLDSIRELSTSAHTPKALGYL
ncbi:MAG: CCA tRNA nucleotidyltransferase, partial [Tateyamaria sp.]